MGTEKQSKASKKQWAKLTPEQRSARMKAANEARWKGISAKKKKEHARRMHEARWGKHKVKA